MTKDNLLGNELQEGPDEEKKSESFKKGIKDPENLFQMLKIVVEMSLKQVVSTVMQFIVLLCNTFYIGNTGDSVLVAGVGMGNSIFMLFGASVMMGLNCALEAFISQSYGASQRQDRSAEYRYEMRRNCGIFYNRGRFVDMIVMVPIILISVFTT